MNNSKLDRLSTASALAEEVWIEMISQGLHESAYDLIGTAVELQTATNRIVWKLNQILSGKNPHGALRAQMIDKELEAMDRDGRTL